MGISHKHKGHRTREEAFQPDAIPEPIEANPAARGGITVFETCKCGAQRVSHWNGDEGETSGWKKDKPDHVHKAVFISKIGEVCSCGATRLGNNLHWAMPPKERTTRALRDILHARERMIVMLQTHPEVRRLRPMGNGELAKAAMCLLYISIHGSNGSNPFAHKFIRENWPWSKGAFRSKTKRRDMIRAVSLLIKEIERQDGDMP